jgi:hypothetical protein
MLPSIHQNLSDKPVQPGWQTIYQIIGFDRPNFVGDVTNAVPQHEHCRITGLWFEGDGIRAKGCLAVQVTDQRHLISIDRQLRAVRGLVSIQQTA